MAGYLTLIQYGIRMFIKQLEKGRDFVTSSFKSAGRCVGKLSNQIRRRLDSLALKGQFSGAQGRALHFILAQTGDVFQKDLEEEFSLRPPTATELLKQMEKNGLVRRESLDSDRRMKKIILTEKALEYQEQVKDGLMELEEYLVKGIPEEKLEIFLEVINRMINNLSD